MIQINPYLSFKGSCRDVLEFYKECLDAELVLQTVKGSPMENQWPPQVQNNILHASLIKDGQVLLLASDMGVEGKGVSGNIISLSLSCSTEEEINSFFGRLSAGGQVTRPLHDFFAGKIGTLTDKFGLNWLFYYDKNQKNNAG